MKYAGRCWYPQGIVFQGVYSVRCYLKNLFRKIGPFGKFDIPVPWQSIIQDPYVHALFLTLMTLAYGTSIYMGWISFSEWLTDKLRAVSRDAVEWWGDGPSHKTSPEDHTKSDPKLDTYRNLATLSRLPFIKNHSAYFFPGSSPLIHRSFIFVHTWSPL
jgi:hypothetical protein